MTDTACPCCATPASALATSPDYTACQRCGHRWRSPAEQAGSKYYASLVQRNDTQAPWFQKKTADRASALANLLTPKVRRILEIGCAEGTLGRAIKATHAVVYDGVELSQDREHARLKLDRVFPTSASQIESAPYDLIASFHVLEHIAELGPELQAWRRLLAPGGQVLIEVPHGAGHPLLTSDRNPEHLHQFTPSSLAMLLANQGFTCHQLSLGHYESPVYPDSIRALARVQPCASERRAALLQRFHQRIGGPFVAYGIGGDFQNYVLPLANALPIQALADTSPAQWGRQFAGHAVAAYDGQRHGAYPLLICSIRFGAAIRQHLLDLGLAPERLIGLEEIYEVA
jgi:SAM-dependent methyltransferase